MSESEPTEVAATPKKPLRVFVVRDFEVRDVITAFEPLISDPQYEIRGLSGGERTEELWREIEREISSPETNVVLASVDRANINVGYEIGGRFKSAPQSEREKSSPSARSLRTGVAKELRRGRGDAAMGDEARAQLG